MNDENLELYLYNQFNEILDKNDSESEKQKRLGQLFITASNSVSAIYLVNHEDEAKGMLAMATGNDVNVNFKSLLKNEWYIYTNIEIWIDFLHSVFNEIKPNHPQYQFYTQVMDSISMIENQMGIASNPLVN